MDKERSCVSPCPLFYVLFIELCLSFVFMIDLYIDHGLSYGDMDLKTSLPSSNIVD